MTVKTYALDELMVGQRFASDSTVLTADMIKAFARTFDPQPFHLDEIKASATAFGGLVASGRHTAAITMKLLVEGGAPFVGGLLGAGADIKWPHPTRPGDTLNVVSQVLDITASRSKPDRGIVTLRSETLNQDGQVVQILTSKIVVAKRALSV